VLVLTGITAAGDARIADTAPDLVVPSIREIVRA
jgi:ribonucleotide monophosphatase NagD (HAD superfamily)